MIRNLAIALFFAGACNASQPDVIDHELGSTRGGVDKSMRVVETDLDTDLANAWGLAVDPDVHEFWIASNGTDTAKVDDEDGVPTGKVVAVPGAPTGEVYTESPDFMGDEFIWATEAGTIRGWQDSFGTESSLRADDSASGAVYKGLAVFPFCDHDAVATTDFAGAKIDLYGPGYGEIDQVAFRDEKIPADFAPFGIAYLGGEVYVSYAKVGPDGDDVSGPGNGYVDVYNTDGSLARRLISGGHLNSPWGMAIAPKGWGKMSNKLLVGNFGDGWINVYEPHSGTWLGAVRDASGKPLVIDGLWALLTDEDEGEVYFTAGPNDEEDGLFGTLAPAK
ncbi:MAG TPA: TIGR03118 family protein [Kofleriaceae bacterium]|jgi:uncharacterized protein (TIGR03118 family)|nr:TIGR03118 family protein [Kofleriaceae bacterium]